MIKYTSIKDNSKIPSKPSPHIRKFLQIKRQKSMHNPLKAQNLQNLNSHHLSNKKQSNKLKT
jgi:hypothetical protein